MDQPSVSYSFYDGILHLRLRDHYTPSDLRRGFLRALEDPNCPREVRFLLDVTESESLRTRSTDDVREMAEFFTSHMDRIGKRFAIAAGADLNFGLMRMAQVYSEFEGTEPKVFRTVEEALSWLRSPLASVSE